MGIRQANKDFFFQNCCKLIIYDPLYQGEYRMADLKEKGLSNIAATLLNLLGYEKPQDYDPSLIEIVSGGKE
jgi:2,3-bisphosphoglycerate-independent phosphoglycerate mutase